MRGTMRPAGRSKYGSDGRRSSGWISGWTGNPGGGLVKSGSSIDAETTALIANSPQIKMPMQNLIYRCR